MTVAVLASVLVVLRALLIGGQPTMLNEYPIHMCTGDDYQLRNDLAKCALTSDVITQTLNAINNRVTRLSSNVYPSASGAGDPRGRCHCEAGGGNGCSSEVKDRLDRLGRDVAAISSSLGQLGAGRNPSTTTRNLSLMNGTCIVDIRSTGCRDGAFKGSHLRVNWTNVHYTDKTGIYLAIIDPVTCQGTPFPGASPSTAVSQAAVLASYINLLAAGQVVAGSTCNDAHNNLGVAGTALGSLGVNNLNKLNYCGKFAFIAQKGSPEKTVSAVKQSAQGNLWLVVQLETGSDPLDVTFRMLNDPNTV